MARQTPRGSWLGALVGLSLLAVLAFGVGAVAGLAWKEPGLLVAYARGDTTEVAWSTAAAELSPAEAPPVAAPAPPEPENEPERPPEPEAKRKPPAVASAPPARPKPAPKATPPSPDGSIAVQVGAFAARDAAEGLRAQLSGAGFPAYLADRQGGDPWRVRVGPFASRDEAGRVARRLEHAQQLPTWILDEAAE